MKRASVASWVCLLVTCALFAFEALNDSHVLLLLHTYICACGCGYAVAAQNGSLTNH